MSVIDIIGMRFGKLTVVEKTDKYYSKGKTFYYRCVCDCGEERFIVKSTILSGRVKSCGCSSRDYVRRNKWSDEEMQIVKDNYGVMDYTELLKLLPKRGVHNVRKMAEKLGLTTDRRKYTYNHNYFSELTNENCYWAGFIAADGYVYRTKDKNQPGLRIMLQARDRGHLEKFVQCVQYSKPVEDCVSSKGSGYIPQARVNVYGCGQWLDDLYNYFNIVQAKSLILEPPNITETEHIISFLAGYIDGDGSIGYSTYKWKDVVRKSTFHINWLGTQQLLEWSKLQLIPILGEGKSNVNKHKGIFIYGVSGARAEQFKSIVLSMGLPILERKWYKEWVVPKEED